MRCTIPMLTKAVVYTCKCFPVWTSFLCLGYLSWYTWRATTALLFTKPYMKCRLANFDLSMLSQQFAINTRLMYTPFFKIWKLFTVVSYWYHNCLDIVNDRKHLRDLRNLLYDSAVLESLDLETTHSLTYVDIKLFLLSTCQGLIPEVLPCIFEAPCIMFLCF